MPIYASSPEFSAIRDQFQADFEAERQAITALTAAIKAGADFQTLRALTEAMELASANVYRSHEEMKKHEIGQ